MCCLVWERQRCYSDASKLIDIVNFVTFLCRIVVEVRVGVGRGIRIICIYAREQTWDWKCVLWICLKANISIQGQAESWLPFKVPSPQWVLRCQSVTAHLRNELLHIWRECIKRGSEVTTFEPLPCIVAKEGPRWSKRGKEEGKEVEDSEAEEVFLSLYT